MSITIRNFVSAVFYQLRRALPEILLHLAKRVVVKRVRLKKKFQRITNVKCLKVMKWSLEKGCLVSPWTCIRFTFNADELFCHDTCASLSAGDTVCVLGFCTRVKQKAIFCTAELRRKSAFELDLDRAFMRCWGLCLLIHLPSSPHSHKPAQEEYMSRSCCHTAHKHRCSDVKNIKAENTPHCC